MALTVRKVTGKDLPPDSTHGFQISDGDEPVMFFHWHEAARVEEALAGVWLPEMTTTPPEINTVRPVTSYVDVLRALPDRLTEMGYEDDRDAVFGSVVDLFGVG